MTKLTLLDSLQQEVCISSDFDSVVVSLKAIYIGLKRARYNKENDLSEI